MVRRRPVSTLEPRASTPLTDPVGRIEGRGAAALAASDRPIGALACGRTAAVLGRGAAADARGSGAYCALICRLGALALFTLNKYTVCSGDEWPDQSLKFTVASELDLS